MQSRYRTLLLLLTPALIAMAGFAPAAQASTEWDIAGEALGELEVEEATLLAKASEDFSLEIPWYATTIKCETLGIPSGTIYPKGKGSATLRLTDCSLSGPPFVAETCKLIEPLDLHVALTLVEHDSLAYALFDAQESEEPVATVSFKKGTECPLPLNNELKGSFVATTVATENVEQPFTVNATAAKLFTEDSLTFGGHPASLSGQATLDLWGIYKGEKWAATATPTGEFRIDGETFKEAKVTKEGVVGEISSGTLSAENGLEIACENGTAAASVGQGGTVEAEAEFEECVFVGSEATCTIVDFKSKEKEGVIEAAATGELVLYEEQHFVEFTAKPFATIVAVGTFCTIPEEENVTGKFIVELPIGLEEKEKQRSVSSGSAQLFLGESPVESVYGEAYPLELESGKPWGAE